MTSDPPCHQRTQSQSRPQCVDDPVADTRGPSRSSLKVRQNLIDTLQMDSARSLHKLTQDTNLLIEVSVKEGVGHVQLMKQPGLIQSDGEEDTDGAEARHRRECLMIVKTIGLRKVTGHETRLVASDGAIKIVLEGVHPLARDNIGINRPRNQRPGLPLDEGRIFHIHRLFPRQYLQLLNIRLGN